MGGTMGDGAIKKGNNTTKGAWGVLGRQWIDPGKGETWQPYIPTTLRQETLYQAHDGPLAAHLGAERTLSALRVIGFWPGCTKDVELYVKTCDICQRKQRRPRHVDKGLLCPMVPDYPWQRIAVDFLGPLPQTKRKNKYILVVIDHFTKWAEAYPTTRLTTKAAADTLVREVIARYGTPHTIHTDQGSAFDSKIFKQIMSQLGIKKTRTTPYHPQADGVVERMNRTLEAMLKATVQENQSDWDTQIPFVLSAYRSTVHSSTGFTPNDLLLGREATPPLAVAYESPQAQTGTAGEPPASYAIEMRDRMRAGYHQAWETLQKSATTQKKAYDQNRTAKRWEEGDEVLFFLPLKKPGLSPKLQQFWTGTWVIKKKISEVVVQIKKERKTRIVHVDLLKSYERIPGIVTSVQYKQRETPQSERSSRKGGGPKESPPACATPKEHIPGKPHHVMTVQYQKRGIPGKPPPAHATGTDVCPNAPKTIIQVIPIQSGQAATRTI